MKAAVDSFESHSDGYISQEFLENDVEEGLDEVEKTTIELTADANSIIASVQDIVDVEKIDETEVVETVHRGKRRVKEIVEELHDLDRSQVASLDSVKEDLQTMKSFLADMESKFKSGELSVGNYSMKAIRDIDAYQSIKESVDGEEKSKNRTLDEKPIAAMSMYEIEKAKDIALKKLKDGERDLLNRAFSDLEKGDIDKETFQTIALGILTIQKEHVDIGWNSELGGYESPKLWDINLEINKQKLIQHYAEKTVDVDSLRDAKNTEDNLRLMFNHVSDHLIGEDDFPHILPESFLKLADDSVFEYRIDSNGTLYYKADPGYEYYEEIQTQTNLEHYHGVLAKISFTGLIGRGIGSISNTFPPLG